MPDGVPLTAAELRIQVSTAKRAKKAARKAEKAAAKAAASYGSVLSQGPDSPDASNDASSFGGGNDASFGGGFSGDRVAFPGDRDGANLTDNIFESAEIFPGIAGIQRAIY